MDQIIDRGRHDTFAATYAWAHATTTLYMAAPENDDDYGRLEYEGPGTLDEQDPAMVLAMRIITCASNNDVETATNLWAAAPQDVAVEATVKVLQIAAEHVKNAA
jgi:hypothetical protein